MISRKELQESISNLLVKLKADNLHAPEDSQTIKLRHIFILSQSSKPNSEMEQVPLNKPEITSKLLVLVKPTSMRQ
jgi:hypothetical protein